MASFRLQIIKFHFIDLFKHAKHYLLGHRRLCSDVLSSFCRLSVYGAVPPSLLIDIICFIYLAQWQFRAFCKFFYFHFPIFAASHRQAYKKLCQKRVDGVKFYIKMNIHETSICNWIMCFYYLSQKYSKWLYYHCYRLLVCISRTLFSPFAQFLKVLTPWGSFCTHVYKRSFFSPFPSLPFSSIFVFPPFFKFFGVASLHCSASHLSHSKKHKQIHYFFTSLWINLYTFHQIFRRETCLSSRLSYCKGNS